MASAGIAENTASTYSTARNKFQSFRGSYNLPNNWPLPLNEVVLFITYCFEKALSARTIATYISGVAFFHKINNWPDFSQAFIVKKLLEGCHRSRRTFDTRAPITMDMLKEICKLLPTICHDAYEYQLFKAMFCLAYFGLFRVGELVSTKGQVNMLQSRDVTLDIPNKHVLISMSRFKTNQRGNPVILKLPCERDGSICPVHSLQKYLFYKSSQTGPLFIHSNGAVATRYQFAAVLKKCIDRSQYNHSNVKTHSFRIGRATQLALMGLSESAIMKLGRWHSPAYNTYIRV